MESITRQYLYSGNIYLNTAGSGLVTEEMLKASDVFRRKVLDAGSAPAVNWMLNESWQVKQEICSLVGANVEDMALVPNFSTGLNFLLRGINTSNNVLLYREDYPSLIMPFELGNYPITWLEQKEDYTISLQEIEDAFNKHNIAVFAVSHVQYTSGFRINLKELTRLCKKYDVLLIVDGTQSVGAMDIHFNDSDIDVLIWSNYKWMNGGFGTGVMCLKKEVIDHFPPAVAGFGSYTFDNGNLRYDPSAKSFEPGHMNMAGYEMLRVAIKHKKEMRLSNIESHINGLTKKLVEGLLQQGFDVFGGAHMPRAGVVCFGADEQIMNKLTDAGIAGTHRFGHIRLSPSFYNSLNDIDTCLAVLRD